MVLVKILKRKDAASVVLAILMAMILMQPLTSMTSKPASIISGLNGSQYMNYGPGSGWQSEYLFPIVWVVVQILVLEALCWVVIFLMWLVKKSPVLRKLV